MERGDNLDMTVARMMYSFVIVNTVAVIRL